MAASVLRACFSRSKLLGVISYSTFKPGLCLNSGF